ncbi:MAG: Ig-like domain-containing protein [bacterium]|jgi:hypothetical protein|nr:Ig-like domain-containing protein [bacterium]
MSKFHQSIFSIILLLISPMIAKAAESPTPTATPPIQVIAPEENCIANVGESLEIMIIAQDGLDIVSVSALCDAKGIGMTQTKPYTIKWDTSNYSPGDYTIRVFAYLKSGEKLSAKPVVVSLVASKGLSAMTTAPLAVVKEGTPVMLQTTAKMVSGETAKGSSVRYKVIRDVVGSSGQVLIPYGASAYGKVITSTPRGMFGKAGKIEFNIESVQGAGETLIPLRASQDATGTSNGGAVVVTTLFLSVLGVFINGRDAVIPEGTMITAFVDHDTPIARPLPPNPGGSKSGSLEMITILSPADKASIREGSKVTIACNIFPPTDVATVKIFLNDELLNEQNNAPRSFVWDTSKYGPGEYQIYMEASFNNGKVVKSSPIKVTVRRKVPF